MCWSTFYNLNIKIIYPWGGISLLTCYCLWTGQHLNYESDCTQLLFSDRVDFDRAMGLF